jgi:protein-S-isoprenylcysteine O-methyltransferase Ste14
MALLAGLLGLLFLAVGFGLRSWLQWRRTGDAGWRLGRPHGPAEAAARASMVGSGIVLAVAIGVAAGDPTSIVGAQIAVGVALALAGMGLVVMAQLQMGASWRIGVDPEERTALVAGGLYRAMRNPIYTGMVAFVTGAALLVPGALAVVAVVAMVIGVEVQVRWVEEGYLAAAHGAAYRTWADHTGRFVPLVGRG